MHIVQIYHSKVPVRRYGGMERVIEALCRGFLELGHKVTLICYKGEYEIPGVNFIDLSVFPSKKDADERFAELIPNDADILHFHLPLKNLDKLPFPYVVTLHGLLKEDEDPKELSPWTVGLTRAHADLFGLKHFVFNGLVPQDIPLSDVPLNQRQGVSFLGRAALKRKGLHLAKAIAKSIKQKLYIGGGRGLSFGNNKYLGHLTNEEKFELLGRTRALLFPIQWEEPFGLVMIEALFCGTPVFGLKRGSVPEVLGQDDLGKQINLYADTTEELLEMIRQYSYEVTPAQIREYACRYFTHIKMCQSYLDIYASRIHFSKNQTC